MKNQDYIQLAQFFCKKTIDTGVHEVPFNMEKLLNLIELDSSIAQGLLDLFEEQLEIRLQILNSANREKDHKKVKEVKKHVKNILRFRLKIKEKVSKNDKIFADIVGARSYLPLLALNFEKYEKNKGRLDDSLLPYLSKLNRPYITDSLYKTLVDLNNSALCIPDFFKMAKQLFNNKELIIISYEEAYDCYFAYSDNIELFQKILDKEYSNLIINDQELVGLSTEDKQKFFNNIFKYYDVIYDYKNFEIFHKGQLEINAAVENKPVYNFADTFSNIGTLSDKATLKTTTLIENISKAINYEKELIDLNIHHNDKAISFNKSKEITTKLDSLMIIMMTYAMPDFIFYDVKKEKVIFSIHSHNALGEIAVSLFNKSYLALGLNQSDIIHPINS